MYKNVNLYYFCDKYRIGIWTHTLENMLQLSSNRQNNDDESCCGNYIKWYDRLN